MPWKVVKRNCKQADGTKGTHVVVKKKSKGRTEQESCHTSEDKADAAARARYASKNETAGADMQNSLTLTREQLRQIIVELMTKLK